MTEREIQILIYEKYSENYHIFPNVYFYNWESDLLMIHKINFDTVEIEIKRNIVDYYKDFDKPKHDKLINKKGERPGKFYFALLDHLVVKLPKYAGLIFINSNKVKINCQAPTISLKKAKREDINFLNEKMYHKFWR